MAITIASKLDDVINLIITNLRALPEFATVTVYDGPAVGKDSPKSLVMIGDDGDPESEALSTFTQEWVNLNKTRKRETGEIPCAAVVWDGGTNMKTQRDNMKVLFSAIESAILALASDDLTVEMNTGSFRPVQNEKGAASVVPFTISYTTTL